jgi:hypothetical protein
VEESGVWRDVQGSTGRRVISIAAYPRAGFYLAAALPEGALVLREQCAESTR